MLEEIAPHLRPGTVVMDMGSSKAEICTAMATLPAGIQPIGGHPMCGKETAGFESAEPGLYHNAPWVLTPLERTNDNAIQLAAELATAVGARPLFWHRRVMIGSLPVSATCPSYSPVHLSTPSPRSVLKMKWSGIGGGWLSRHQSRCGPAIHECLWIFS